MINNSVVKYLGRFIISAVLIGFFLHNIDTQALIAIFQRLSWALMLLALALVVFTRMFIYYRMKLLLEAGGDRIPYAELVKVGWMGDFGTFFVPGLLGSDLMRIYILQHYLSDVTRAASAIIYERFIGLASLGLVVFLSILWCHDFFVRLGLYIPVLLVCLALLGALLAFFLFPDTILRISGKIFKDSSKPGRKLQTIVNSIMAYANYKVLFSKAFLICLLTQVMRVLVCYVITRGIGVSVDMKYFFLFVPIIFFILMAPVSVGGFGVREGASVFLFSYVGVSQADAFMMALLTSFVIVFYSLPGGFFFITRGLLKRETEKA